MGREEHTIFSPVSRTRCAHTSPPLREEIPRSVVHMMIWNYVRLRELGALARLWLRCHRLPLAARAFPGLRPGTRWVQTMLGVAPFLLAPDPVSKLHHRSMTCSYAHTVAYTQWHKILDRPASLRDVDLCAPGAMIFGYTKKCSTYRLESHQAPQGTPSRALLGLASECQFFLDADKSVSRYIGAALVRGTFFRLLSDTGGRRG